MMRPRSFQEDEEDDEERLELVNRAPESGYQLKRKEMPRFGYSAWFLVLLGAALMGCSELVMIGHPMSDASSVVDSNRASSETINESMKAKPIEYWQNLQNLLSEAVDVIDELLENQSIEESEADKEVLANEKTFEALEDREANDDETKSSNPDSDESSSEDENSGNRNGDDNTGDDHDGDDDNKENSDGGSSEDLAGDEVPEDQSIDSEDLPDVDPKDIEYTDAPETLDDDDDDGGDDEMLQNQSVEKSQTEKAKFSPLAARQIQNFRRGEGTLLNIHLTHHGGTTVCGELKHNLKSPTFACMGPKDEDGVGDDYPRRYPWTKEDTAKNLAIVHQYFQLFSWEFKSPTKNPPLHETDFENPNLVTMFVTRDPLSRSLAGDGNSNKLYPGVMVHHNATNEEWWRFAREFASDNFALRAMSSVDCCDGRNTEPMFLEMAKELLRRFTFVLDIDCLDRGLQKVADILGFSLPENVREHHPHPPVKDRIPFPDVYKYLTEENKLGIEFHEWAKSIALVDCDAE